MDKEEINNNYAIPANYTDSGKLLGMLETRNAVEAVGLVAIIGYIEVMYIPIGLMGKVVLAVVTLLPIGIFAAIGIDGDSLLQFLGHVIWYWRHRRILHFRRVGHVYKAEEVKGAKRTKKGKSTGKGKKAKKGRPGKSKKT